MDHVRSDVHKDLTDNVALSEFIVQPQYCDNGKGLWSSYLRAFHEWDQRVHL